MKIFLIGRGFPTDKDPQWGNFELDQARALVEKGHEVIMLSVDVRFSRLKNKLGITKVKKYGLVSYSLNPGPWIISNIINNRFYYWIYSRFLLKLFENIVKLEGLPDIIYTHYQDSALAMLPIKGKYKIPIVGLEHWSALGLDIVPRIALKHGRVVYPNLDKVLVVSTYLRDNIKKYFNIDSEVVNNIIGNEFYFKEYNNTGVIHFVLIGNLIPRKCFDIVIKAISTLVSDYNNIKFTIVGDGPEKKHLRSLIEEYDLTKYVELVGRKSRSFIVNLLQKTDVFILSSSSETFGVAAVEALACGVPVISTDCGGARDFMNEFNGLVIPINDINAMEKAIRHMIDHYLDFDRKRIAHECKRRFSSKTIANQLTSIFESVIKK